MGTIEMTTTIREALAGGGSALVLGFGRSGRAAYARLLERGLTCRVADRAPEGVGVDPAARFSDDDLAALEGVDLVIKSPGVSRAHRLIEAALAGGIPVFGELELGWAICRAPLFAVTGSNGKSTTTALLAHLFTCAGLDARAAGNIGDPLTALAPLVPPEGAIALEVSSFQLEDLVAFACRGAALLNVSPDHLDRHGTMGAYVAIKAGLLERVEPGGRRVVDAEDTALAPILARWRASAPAETFGVSLDAPLPPGAYVAGDALVLDEGAGAREILPVSQLSIRGPHNVKNALFALTLAAGAGVADDAIAEGLRTFRPLPHRLEPVGRAGGVLFVNDSKATNLDSLRVALLSFESRVVLIAGGRDKGSPFDDLAPLVSDRVRHLVTIGEAAETIAAAWPDVTRVHASTLADAVESAYAAARPNGVVLLSPGCASFDMFESYIDRGDRFRAIVAGLAEREG